MTPSRRSPMRTLPAESSERFGRRIVVMAAMTNAQDHLQQLLVIRLAMDRVDRSGIDDQERRGVEIVEEPGVRVAEPLQILLVYRLLIGDAARRDAAYEHVRRRLKVDDEVGLRRIEIEGRGHLVIKLQLVRIEVELGEETVLVEQEIGDSHRGEHV